MKYVLTPLTMFLWYLTTYYGLYFCVIGMAYMFSVGWFWIIMGWLVCGTFIIFLVMNTFLILNGIPFQILTIYGINWFSCIVHSLAGVIGVVHIIRFFNANLPELVIGDESFFILTGMWKIAPVKTVFLAFPFVGLAITLLWSTTICPVYIKLSDHHAYRPFFE
ncbi:MAG: hypothetical protein HQ551_01230 [Desulfobacteraceae bacterium]|nr:hypothetical protein [Desulfobacteraceae bacterium]